MSLTENVNTELAKTQLLLERRVDSSWLEDIVYRGKHNTIFPGEELIFFKAKKNPKMYICRGLTHNDYVKWINADKFKMIMIILGLNILLILELLSLIKLLNL